jgi:hypothetical protein
VWRRHSLLAGDAHPAAGSPHGALTVPVAAQAAANDLVTLIRQRIMAAGASHVVVNNVPGRHTADYLARLLVTCRHHPDFLVVAQES